MQRWTRFAAVSAALLVPVYWHRRVEAGDLASHIYNAWLAQLIREGQAPGLWIARQWNNVLFDWILSSLGSMFGLPVAEKIAVSLAVLVFFWGAFAWIGAISGRAPWSLSPLLAVFAYGWTFEMGFMNYYISLGLCFLAWAVLWRYGAAAWLAALALLPLIWMAHPLGVFCFLAVAIYAALARSLRPAGQISLFVASGIALAGLRVLLVRHYEVRWNNLARFFFFNGADQLALYSHRYYLLYALFAGLMIAAFAIDAISRLQGGTFWKAQGLPLQLYLTTVLASLLLPSVVKLPQYAQPVSYLIPRLSSISGILACCMLAAAIPKKWHIVGSSLIAACFFLFLYIDTGRLNGIEQQVEQSVAALPPGHRVVGDIDFGEESRVVTEHIVDRACIGHCFSYLNYEAATGQFRVHAAPGNSMVQVDLPSDFGRESTQALAKSLDRPVFEIFQCGESATRICVRELSEDEIDDLVEGYVP